MIRRSVGQMVKRNGGGSLFLVGKQIGVIGKNIASQTAHFFDAGQVQPILIGASLSLTVRAGLLLEGRADGEILGRDQES